MKFIKFSLLTFILSSLLLLSCQKPTQTDLQNQYLDTLVDVLHKKKSFNSPYSDFVKTKDGVLKKITFELSIKKKVTTVEKAREMIVSSAEFVLNYVNNEHPLNPEWRKTPFSPEELLIDIFFEDGVGKREPGFAAVTLIDGEILYTWEYRAKAFPDEKYEEAKQKILEARKGF